VDIFKDQRSNVRTSNIQLAFPEEGGKALFPVRREDTSNYTNEEKRQGAMERTKTEPSLNVYTLIPTAVGVCEAETGIRT